MTLSNPCIIAIFFLFGNTRFVSSCSVISCLAPYRGKNFNELKEISQWFDFEADVKGVEHYSLSKTWRFVKQFKTLKGKPLSSENLGLIKTPNSTTLSLGDRKQLFMRHHGKCAKNEENFKLGEPVLFVGSNYMIPNVTVVSIAEHAPIFPHRVFVSYQSERADVDTTKFLVNYADLRKIVPAEPDDPVSMWLSAILHSQFDSFAMRKSNGQVVYLR